MLEGIVLCLIGGCLIYASARARTFRREQQGSITGRLIDYPGAKVGDVVPAVMGVVCVIGAIIRLLR